MGMCLCQVWGHSSYSLETRDGAITTLHRYGNQCARSLRRFSVAEPVEVTLSKFINRAGGQVWECLELRSEHQSVLLRDSWCVYLKTSGGKEAAATGWLQIHVMNLSNQVTAMEGRNLWLIFISSCFALLSSFSCILIRICMEYIQLKYMIVA